MVHIIPLSVGQRRRDAGDAPLYPAASPGGEAAPLDHEWQALADHHERRVAQQQAFDTEIAARRLNGEIAKAETDAVANAAADGAGLHDAMYGQVDPHTGRVVQQGWFDTLFDNFLKQTPPELHPGLASRKAALRAAGSTRMAMQQLRRRNQYEQDQLSAAQAAELSVIAQSDPNDTATFDASRNAGLDLIARMNLDPQGKAQAEAAWRESTAKARIEALIAWDPKRALEMLSAGPVASHRWVDATGTEPLADLSSDNIRRLLGKARGATATQLVEAQVNIDLAAQNAPEAIANTGSYSGAMPSPADFTAVYGEEEGGKRYQDFSRRIEVGRQAFGMRIMPNQAIHAALRDAEPGVTNSQEEIQTKRDLIAEAAKPSLNARTADPGAYVRQVFPTVDAAWRNVSNTKGYQTAILWSVSAQHQLGIEDIQPLPNSIAEDATMSSIANRSQHEETRGLCRSLLEDVRDPSL